MIVIRQGRSKIAIYLICAVVVLQGFAQEAPRTPHQQLKRDCAACHTAEGWHIIHFDHDSTAFPLRDSHARIGQQCTLCHNLSNFSEASSACNSCHVDVHQGKLPMPCQTCHTPSRWTRVDGPRIHQQTNFPLLGSHLQLDCQACHISEIENEFSFLKTECVSCHQQDFQAASTPVHQSPGLDENCQECHQQSAWLPAGFPNHDALFPIHSGEHAGKWSTCGDCHVDSRNFGLFSCLTCHEHNQSKMDKEHREVSGYVYQSEACLTCHPTGGE